MRPGLPEVFIGFDPLPRPPVELPEDATARAIVELASASTFRVVAATCGYESSGQRRGRGARRDRDQRPRRGRRPARRRAGHRRGRRASTTRRSSCSTPTSTWRSSTSTGWMRRPCRFAAADPERGALGAALGYPGGGALTVVPAAVAGAYPATGRDIYARGPRPARHPRAARPDRSRRQRRPVRPRGRHDRRAGLRRGPDGRPGRLRPGAERVAARIGPALDDTERVATGRLRALGPRRRDRRAAGRRPGSVGPVGLQRGQPLGDDSRSMPVLDLRVVHPQGVELPAPRTMSRHGAVHVTVAVRGMWASSASSPKCRPAPRSRRCWPSRSTETVPSTMT